MTITPDDPRLTAYALNELDEAGRIIVEAEMGKFGECRREIEKIARTAAQVSAGLAAETLPAWLPAQQHAIEAELKRTDSKAKLSWIPSGENAGFARWGLKVALALAVVLLLCQVPLPVAISNGVRTCFDNVTAETAYAMIKMSGTRGVYKDGLRIATLPSRVGIEVAPACAVYRSSLILLVGSVLAGNFYLRSWWKRVSLTLFVIPLVIVRTAFHAFTIFEVFHHGSGSLIYFQELSGQIIFALSLIPFLLLLVWLRRSESKPGSSFPPAGQPGSH